jgi:hypothetical protein
MQIISWKDDKIIKTLINEFLVSNQVKSNESIPIEFLKYLRTQNMKIEDGTLFNELTDLIESKLKLG